MMHWGYLGPMIHCLSFNFEVDMRWILILARDSAIYFITVAFLDCIDWGNIPRKVVHWHFMFSCINIEVEYPGERFARYFKLLDTLHRKSADNEQKAEKSLAFIVDRTNETFSLKKNKIYTLCDL